MSIHFKETQNEHDPTLEELAAQTSPTVQEIIKARVAITERWCKEHGKDSDSLSFDDVLSIRALPDWKAASSDPTTVVFTSALSDNDK